MEIEQINVLQKHIALCKVAKDIKQQNLKSIRKNIQNALVSTVTEDPNAR